MRVYTSARLYGSSSLLTFCSLYLLFFILQLFAANQNKPPDIVTILIANRSKLLRLFADFKLDKGEKVYMFVNKIVYFVDALFFFFFL